MARAQQFCFTLTFEVLKSVSIPMWNKTRTLGHFWIHMFRTPSLSSDMPRALDLGNHPTETWVKTDTALQNALTDRAACWDSNTLPQTCFDPLLSRKCPGGSLLGPLWRQCFSDPAGRAVTQMGVREGHPHSSAFNSPYGTGWGAATAPAPGLHARAVLRAKELDANSRRHP